MFDTIVTLLRLIFGDGLKTVETIKNLKGDNKRKLFHNLIRLHETLEYLESNIDHIIFEYVDDFIVWLSTGAIHNLSSYCSSVKSFLRDSSEEVQQLLEFWDRNNGVGMYLKLRDEQTYHRLIKFLGYKGNFKRLLKEYSAPIGNSTYDDISIPYIASLVELITDEREGWIRNNRYSDQVIEDITVKFCRIDDLDNLNEYRSYLLNLKMQYEEYRHFVKCILLDHFCLEEMF